MSARDALRKYYERNGGRESSETAPTRRKNKRPERDVEIELKQIFIKLGFSMSKVESKAVYNHTAGRYLDGKAQAGVSDWVGCTSDGTGCFVEVKAPSRRSTLKPHQYIYLEDKINRGAFAVCVDSVDLFIETFKDWENRRAMNKELAKNFLLRSLPARRRDPDLDL